MKTYDFIKQAIGTYVIINGSRDLSMCGEFRKLIQNKTELKLLKLTKGGNAYVQDEQTGEYYSVPPTNIEQV